MRNSKFLWIATGLFLFITGLLAQNSTVVIAEVLYDSPFAFSESSLNKGEFISLYNYEEDDVNIGGWRVQITDLMNSTQNTYTYTIPNNTILPAFSLAVIASRCAGSTFNIGDFYSSEDSDESGNITLYTQDLVFPNTRSLIQIYDAQNNIQDELRYDGNTDSLPGETLLRAYNGDVNPFLLGDRLVSIQRKSIKIEDARHTISRDDYSGQAHFVQLYSFLPEEYSYGSTRKGPNTLVPEDEALTGTITNNQEKKASNITSSQVIVSGKSVYLAEEKVVLEPGFEVKNGAEFHLTVDRDSFHVVPILTYNLWGKNTPDYGVHAKYINLSGTAIVSVQEVQGAQRFKTLKKKTGMDGTMCTTINGIFVKYGIGMLWDKSRVGSPSRIKKSRTATLLKEDGDTYRGYIMAEFPEFCFIATHFNATDDCCERMTKKIFNEDIFKDCKGKKPIYIAGDMNNEPGSTAIKRFTDEGFRILNDINSEDHKTIGRHIDLIMEHNNNQDKGYYKLIDRGIPLTEEQKKEWRNNKVSDHFPYFVKVKMK